MKRTINEHELRDVIDFWVKAYKIKKGEKLWKYETYIDQVKGKIFIVTYIDKAE